MIGDSTNSLSIIAPVWNEINRLPLWLSMLLEKKEGALEIIVVDGGSTDGSWEWLQQQPKIRLFQCDKGRAKQLALGAQKALGSIFFFVHVDTQLPKGFDKLIKKAHAKNHLAGCFQMRFAPHNSIGLRIAGWGTCWNHLLFRGGDQTLFVAREVYHAVGGFDTTYRVCEDLEIIKKLYIHNTFTILPQKVVTDSRKFEQKGTATLLFHFRILHLMHWLGATEQSLFDYYQRYVNE